MFVKIISFVKERKKERSSMMLDRMQSQQNRMYILWVRIPPVLRF